MSEQKTPEVRMPDPAELSKTMSRIAEQSQRLVKDFMERQSQEGGNGFAVMDPKVVTESFQNWLQAAMQDPQRLAQAQMQLWTDYMTLWQTASRRMLGQEAEPVATPAPGDKRFKDDAWQENPVFDYVKQSYLLASRYVHEVVKGTEGLDEHTADKVEFYTRQYIDAMSPTNFAMTNPQVVRRTMETGGENLVTGLSHMLDDLERGRGKLRVKMTDLDKFALGENVAVTPGKVVFQNELMQLLQYTPTTETVHRTPLLIVPPWINKFYILDLREKNSFIKWAVDQGHTVFVISWVNPDGALAEKQFADYMHDGPLAALDAVEKAVGERQVKAIGYCLGGTLLAATLAWMKAKGDDRIKSATFFTTMVDFSEPGELGVFIDDEQLTLVEKQMEKTGYFDGANMAEAFNLLRANDLIWSFVINNYLMGREPFPFDLLYWNSDSTRMPRAMHSFYLRTMYERNQLCVPGGVKVDDVDIDLSKIDIPVYILSAKEDHIAPWTSTYAATQLYGGPIRFVLGASGHIAGVINPPAANKYGYWTGDEMPADPAAWLEAAQMHEGSWWSDWDNWEQQFNGEQVPAREPGAGDLPALEDAPGSFVKVRIS